MSRLRWVVVSVAVVMALLGIVLISALGTNNFDQTNATTGHRAPAFSLPTLAGGTATLGAGAGKVTVVNYWNDWCIPCQNEHAALDALWKGHQGDPNFSMIGIVHDAHSRADIVKYARDRQVGWPIAFDPGAKTALDYAVTGQPETFVIDKRGIVQRWISGPIDLSTLEPLVEKLEAA
jgi:cytochrome c biogenesis protein CcmG/thiol:disulfide interchange protein DsbE